MNPGGGPCPPGGGGIRIMPGGGGGGGMPAPMPMPGGGGGRTPGGGPGGGPPMPMPGGGGRPPGGPPKGPGGPPSAAAWEERKMVLGYREASRCGLMWATQGQCKAGVRVYLPQPLLRGNAPHPQARPLLPPTPVPEVELQRVNLGVWVPCAGTKGRSASAANWQCMWRWMVNGGGTLCSREKRLGRRQEP